MGERPADNNEHDVLYGQSTQTGTWRWDCDECQWTGFGCPSRDFAEREHQQIAVARGEG